MLLGHPGLKMALIYFKAVSSFSELLLQIFFDCLHVILPSSQQTKFNFGELRKGHMG